MNFNKSTLAKKISSIEWRLTENESWNLKIKATLIPQIFI